MLADRARIGWTVGVVESDADCSTPVEADIVFGAIRAYNDCVGGARTLIRVSNE